MDAARLRDLLSRATPLPWRWYGNTQSHMIAIAAVKSGIPFVMTFARWGMNSAQPRFAVGRDPGELYGGIMTDASEMARYEVLEGRTIAEARKEPYRYDVVGIDHPDAELLVAAVNALPDLLGRIDVLEEIAEAAAHYLDDPHEESGRTLASRLTSSAASGEERNG